jgi:hypothetical protein
MAKAFLLALANQIPMSFPIKHHLHLWHHASYSSYDKITLFSASSGGLALQTPTRPISPALLDPA